VCVCVHKLAKETAESKWDCPVSGLAQGWLRERDSRRRGRVLSRERHREQGNRRRQGKAEYGVT
jgi:hypothetical protein